MNEVTVNVDFDGVFKVLGAGTAMAKTVASNAQYIGAVTDVAIGQRINYFNNVVAPAAGSTGYIKHMYEWGTVGINPAGAGARARPQEERARLWKTVTIGGGFTKDINYVFKPSVVARPLPTTGETGISQAVISKMRRVHVWTHKAETMENGGEVEIDRTDAKFMLIPKWRGTNTTQWRTSDKRRGYILLRLPVTMTIGNKTKGNFDRTFGGFWTNGDTLTELNTSVQKQVELDFLPFFKENRGTTMESAARAALSVNGKVNQAEKHVEQVAIKQARARASEYSDIL